MRAFIVSLIAILASFPLLAQTSAPKAPSQITTPFGPIPNPGVNTTPEPPAKLEVDMSDWKTQIFRVRYVDTGDLYALLSMFQCKIQPDSRLNALVVKAPKDVLPAIGDAISLFDVPSSVPKDVEITAYLILAAPDAGMGGDMPAALRPVIEQMRNIFNYKSYTVIDTDFARARHGERFTASGTLGKLSASDSSGPSYVLNGLVRVAGESNNESVRIDNFMCQFKESGENQQISTSVDIKKNQQVVVGKSTFKDRALILVMSAKVVE